MSHTLGFYGRLALLTLQKDVARGGLCVILMVVLAVEGLPWWLALLLPVLAYPGLWLIASSAGQTSESKKQRPTPRTDGEAYATCLRLQREIQALSSRIDDRHASGQLRRITSWIDRILGAIAEDGKYRASMTLLNLVGPTCDLITGYVKVVRRGFGGAEVQERIRENLATLETAYERFWVQLNRDAIVNLESLSETIDFNLK